MVGQGRGPLGIHLKALTWATCLLFAGDHEKLAEETEEKNRLLQAELNEVREEMTKYRVNAFIREKKLVVLYFFVTYLHLFIYFYDYYVYNDCSFLTPAVGAFVVVVFCWLSIGEWPIIRPPQADAFSSPDA